MARRNKDDVLGVTGAETIIGSGVVAQGTFNSDGDMVIDGTLTGKIQTTGDVTIGVNGQVKADIKANAVTIAGALEGNVSAEGEVSIRETGRVSGDVTAAGLAITSGGIFTGRNTVRQHHELNLTPDQTDEA